MKSILFNGLGTCIQLACIVAVSGCGGGGNESGPGDAIQASPSAVSVMGSATNCASGVGPTVYVYGGQPPYKLSNSAPQAMHLDKSVLANSGDGFVITFTGQCLDQIPITIEDDVGRVQPVPVTNMLGS